MRIKWPKANWLFPTDNPQYAGMLEAYARGDCKVLAIGKEDSTMDVDFMNKMCGLDLVYTDVLVIENPIAFPINPQRGSPFSYWMYTAEKTYGVDLNSVKNAFIEKNDIKPKCEIQLSQLSNNSEELPRVSPSNMFLPIMFFVGCALIAAAMEMYHESKRRKGRTTTFGRKSTLDIYAGINKSHASEILGEEDRHHQTLGDGDVDRTGDDFHDNGAPRSSAAPKTILKGPTDGMAITIENADDALREEGNDVSQRIEELIMQSSAMEEVLLDCVDFFQEMKKLKKDL